MKINDIEKCCDTCVFNMPGNGTLICAGREDSYGKETPIIGVDYESCWEMADFIYLECEDAPIFPWG